MGNALSILDQGPPALPAELAEQLEDGSNLPERATVPSLSYSGKVWSINMNGEQTKIEGKNQDGDLVPLPVMRVIILDWARNRGRAYYAGAYDPAKTAMPNCWSDDGDKPSQYVKEKQNDVCKTCPMAAKGSKITDTKKETTACSIHRMIAVVPAAKPFDFPPLRLKLAVTSDFDSQSPDHEANGWFSFRPFTDQLKARNVKHTSQIITKMKFDPNVAFPKVLFSTDKWTPTDTLEKLIPIALSDEVKALIGGSWTPNGVDGTPTKAAFPEPEAEAEAEEPADEGTIEEQVAPVAPAKKVVATARTAPVAATKAAPKAAPKPPAEDGEDIQEEWIAPGSPEPSQAAASRPTTTQAKPVARSVQQPAKAQPVKVQASAQPKTATPPVSETPNDPALAGLLDEWDV